MARALPAGPAPRRRTFFGLLDADGWGWASLKAFFWFIVIIFLLGYVPDRAYYFTVSRTIDLGLLAWSPVNLCPAEPNEDLPCPVPVGAVTPWYSSPQELALPEPRVDAAMVQAGTSILLIGGSTDVQGATDSVLVARTSGTGNFDRWQEGPPLPEPRRDAGVAFLNGLIYVVGGYDAEGAPTDTTFVLSPDLQTGDLGTWQTAEEIEQPLDLPEVRASAPLVALADGLLLVGGVGADGQPTRTAWKTTVDSEGALGEWTPQAELAEPSADAVGLLNGEFVWLIGGRDGSGPTARVQRGTITGAASDAVGEGVEADDPPGSGQGVGEPNAPADEGSIGRWAVNDAANLPAPRMNAMGFAANGTVYSIGDSDGAAPQNDVHWATPIAGGDGDDLPEWRQLDRSNLPEPGRERAAVGQIGPNLFAVGGVSSGPQSDSLRTNLSPQAPFFQAGLVGVVVPALKIDGEIGQQLGYLNAAGAGTATFVLLIVIGWAYAHKERTRELMHRLRRRRAGG